MGWFDRLTMSGLSRHHPLILSLSKDGDGVVRQAHHERGLAHHERNGRLAMSGLSCHHPLILSLSKDGDGVVRQAHHERNNLAHYERGLAHLERNGRIRMSGIRYYQQELVFWLEYSNGW